MRRPVEGLVAVQLDGVELRGGDDVEDVCEGLVLEDADKQGPGVPRCEGP